MTYFSPGTGQFSDKEPSCVETAGGQLRSRDYPAAKQLCAGWKEGIHTDLAYLRLISCVSVTCVAAAPRNCLWVAVNMQSWTTVPQGDSMKPHSLYRRTAVGSSPAFATF